jgi:hypothetical protein
MKSVEQKRGRGRPATGQTPIIAVRLSADEIRRVDELAAEWGVDRSKALRELLGHGLSACTRKKKQDAAAERRAVPAKVLAHSGEPEPTIASSRRPGYRRPPTAEEVKAAADRAERRAERSK